MNTLEFFKDNLILFKCEDLEGEREKKVQELMSELSNSIKFEKSELEKRQSEYELANLHQTYLNFIN